MKLEGNIVHLYVAIAIPISFVWYFSNFYKRDLFCDKACSQVVAPFTYCDIYWCYCSKLLLDSGMTQPFALLERESGG